MWTEECGYYLVEWYRPEFTAHDLDAIVAGLSGGAIASATDSGSAPTLIAVLAAPADEVVYGLFAAASPDAPERDVSVPDEAEPDEPPVLERIWPMMSAFLLRALALTPSASAMAISCVLSFDSRTDCSSACAVTMTYFP